MSPREPSSKNPTATSLTPPPTQLSPAADTPMTEGPSTESTPTTTTTTIATAATTTTATCHTPTAAAAAAAAAVADNAMQIQHQETHHQRYSPPEQAPLVTEMPPANTFPREPPPREPIPSQPTPRSYDSNPQDRIRPHLSSYHTAPDSLPQTPHAGMPAPSVPWAHTSTPADRVTHQSSYPTAPASASQTPLSGRSQTPQQGMVAAGWLASPEATSSSRITFEGTFSLFSTFLYAYSFTVYLLYSSGTAEKGRRKGKKRKAEKTSQGAPHVTLTQHRLPLSLGNHL